MFKDICAVIDLQWKRRILNDRMLIIGGLSYLWTIWMLVSVPTKFLLNGNLFESSYYFKEIL